MRRGLAMLAALLIAAPALAQPKISAIPPPANAKEATLQAWAKAHIDVTGFSFAMFGETAAYYLRPALNQVAAPGRRRIWLRQERYAADNEGVRGLLSLYEFDCPQMRRRLLAVDTYGEVDLREPLGEGNFDTDEGQARWIYVRPGSLGEELMAKACALTGAPFSAAAP